VELQRVLFCDYDGEFQYADSLSQVGYLVDQIRPDALRSIMVGEHLAYILSFESDDSCKKALRVCEKLKMAELKTPIFLVYRSGQDPNFLNHRGSEHSADGYLLNPQSESPLLDVLADRVGLTPLPFFGASDSEIKAKIADYELKIEELEKELLSLKGAATSLDKALEAQRNFYKPRLKALLEGQKAGSQTESEQLRVRLSEVEAKLLEREAKLKELEQSKKSNEMKIQKILESHQKAQQSLRQFYQEKIKKLTGK
jgi:hypothetical protein